MIRGIRESFDSLPLMSVGINASVLDLVIRMFESATMLAIRLAAPVLVTMLIVDLTLGFLGKTMPQLNVMTAGLSMKSIIGVIVMIIGLTLYSTPSVIGDAVNQMLNAVRMAWHTPMHP
jgi:flagellar biosynthetic protein FliR